MNAGNDKNKLLSDINVTPLVDVMLVLLIIFMVTAPMMQQGIGVDLPQISSQELPKKEDQLILTITKKKKLFIDKHSTTLSQLKTTLQKIYEHRTRKEIFLKADRTIPYGFVVEVMGEIKKAGIERLGMVTESLLEKK